MIFIVLCVFETTALVSLLCLYHTGFYTDFWSFLLSRRGTLFLSSSFIIVLSVLFFIWAVQSTRFDKRKLVMACAANAIMLTILLASSEIAIRLLSHQTQTGETFRSIRLYPRKWIEVKTSYNRTLDRMAQEKSFLIYDPVLGWTVGPSRRNATGESISSAEGLRSPRIGMAFADPHTRHSGFSEKRAVLRIALIGDSMTYGNEVQCEDSWPHALEAQLGEDIQVLNFGVSGYGLNQLMLRYEKDIRSWKPQIVIIGVTSLEIQRLVWVYKFLNPYWSGDPFVYPRLIETNGAFTYINHPAPTPSEVIAHSSLQELPNVELDANYHRLQWEGDGFWPFLQKSYLFRLLTSLRYPSEPIRKGTTEEDRQSLSQYVLTSLKQRVEEDGWIPLVVSFPYQFELKNALGNQPSYSSLTIQTLQDAGIGHYDLTRCLVDAQATDEFMPKGHYSPKANAIIASCLQPIVQQKLSSLKMR